MKKKQKGFTLVELVIVIAVIAILAAVLIPTFSAVIKNANNSADLQLVNNLNIVAATHQATGNSNEFDSADNIRTMLKEEGINADSLSTKNKDVIIVYNTQTNKFERCTVSSDKLVAFADEAEESDFYVGYYLEEIFENRIIVSTQGNDLAEAIHSLHNLPSDVNGDYINKQLKKIPSELQEKVQFIMESAVFINKDGKAVTFNGSTEPTISNEITEDKTRIIFYEQEQDFDLSNLNCPKTSLHAIIPNYVTINGNHNASMHFAGNTGALEENGSTVEKVAVAREHAKKCDNKRSTILSIAGDLELNLYDFYSNGTLEELSWNNFQNKFGDKFTGAINEKGEEVESITLNSMTDGTNSYSSETVASVYGGTYQINATVDGIVLNKLIKFKTVQIGSKIDYNGSATWYTIEEALATATSGQTIVIAGSITEQTTSCDAIVTVFTQLDDTVTDYSDAGRTIGTGVTLLLPYDGVSQYNESSSNTSGEKLGKLEYRKLELYVPAGKTIINNGTINIGGYTTGGSGGNTNGAGYTAGRYAQITLSTDATIESVGNINAYGFIIEETDNNGSEVNMSGGTLLMPFVVMEHRGGTNLMKWYTSGGSSKVLPFNRYYMQNVTSMLKVNSGANVIGWLDFFMGGSNVTQNVYFIGDTTNDFFQLESGSYVTWKYDKATKIIDFNTYGNNTINSLSVSVKYNISISIDSKNVFVPIPWHYNITLNPLEGGTATVTSEKQDIKLLPGAKLTIAQGVTAKFRNVIVYGDNWVDNGIDNPNHYPTSTVREAKLIINGTLNVTNIGGCVNTETDDAKLSVKGSVKVTSYEVPSSFGTFSTKWDTYERTLTNTDGSELSAGSYVSDGSKWIAA